jgi:hypothetical protein
MMMKKNINLRELEAFRRSKASQEIRKNIITRNIKNITKSSKK